MDYYVILLRQITYKLQKFLSRVRVSAMSTILVSNMDTLSKIKICLAMQNTIHLLVN